MQTGPLESGALFVKFVRRCPTLPHTPVCSTIGAGGLSFRVRNGTGRFPSAMTTETLSNTHTQTLTGVVFQNRIVDAYTDHVRSQYPTTHGVGCVGLL